MVKQFIGFLQQIPNHSVIRVRLFSALIVCGTIGGSVMLGQYMLTIVSVHNVGPTDLGSNGPLKGAMLLLAAAWLGVISALNDGRRLTSHTLGNTANSRFDMTDFSNLVADLKNLVANQQAEFFTLQKAHVTMTQDSLVAGARLKTFAIEVDDRLRSGLESLVSVLRQPSPAIERAVETIQRLETIGPVVFEASRQALALMDAAATLQRDVTGLAAAGRDIATAGAHVVARMSDVASHISFAAAALPDAATSAVALMQAATDAIAGTMETFSESGRVLDTSRHLLNDAATALQTDWSDIRDLQNTMGQRTSEIAAALDHVSDGLPMVCQTIEAQVARLMVGVESLSTTTDDAVRGATACCASVVAVEVGLKGLPSHLNRMSGVIGELQLVAARIDETAKEISKVMLVSAAHAQESRTAVTDEMSHSIYTLDKISAELRSDISQCYEASDVIKHLGDISIRTLEHHAQYAEQILSAALGATMLLREQAGMLAHIGWNAGQHEERDITLASLKLDNLLHDINVASRDAGADLCGPDAGEGRFATVNEGLTSLLQNLHDVMALIESCSQAAIHRVSESSDMQAAKLGERVYETLQLIDAKLTSSASIAAMESCNGPTSDLFEVRLMERLNEFAERLPSLADTRALTEIANDLCKTQVGLKGLGVDLKPLLNLELMLEAATTKLDNAMSQKTFIHIETFDRMQGVVQQLVTQLAMYGNSLDVAVASLDMMIRNVVYDPAYTVKAVNDIVAERSSGEKSWLPVVSFDRISVLDRDIERLKEASKAILEAAGSKQPDQDLLSFSARSATILVTVDKMVQGLRSVGTTVALASDAILESKFVGVSL